MGYNKSDNQNNKLSYEQINSLLNEIQKLKAVVSINKDNEMINEEYESKIRKMENEIIRNVATRLLAFRFKEAKEKFNSKTSILVNKI